MLDRSFRKNRKSLYDDARDSFLWRKRSGVTITFMIMAKIFDYKSIDASTPSGVGKMMTEARKLGKEGWELVSVCPTSSSEFGIETVTAFLKKESAS